MTHTDLPQVDSIELYNSTETSVDISGWWLTDNNNQHAKFQIPSGSIIAAGSYLIFDETDFNPTPLTPLEHHFSLNSAKGDDIYLLKGSIGNTRPLAFCDHVEFGAALNGVVFGRSLMVIHPRPSSLLTQILWAKPIPYLDLVRSSLLKY